MDRKAVVAGLKAYKGIEDDIKSKLRFAREIDKDRAKYKKEAEELRCVRREMISCLNALPQLERECIWDHYIMGDIWVRISQKRNYSEKQVRNIANRGLKQLERLFAGQPRLVRFCRSVKGSNTY